MKKITILILCFMSLTVNANNIEFKNLISDDAISVTYVNKVVLETVDSWVGERVYQKDETCYKKTNTLETKSHNLTKNERESLGVKQDTFKISSINSKIDVVDCIKYKGRGLVILN
ncbi:hypothetical protein [Photobacterium leiognathi]|uniref:hypothetical protein n=1 Tax=Photobacterium leiognathi TaxID=553611 RepID=UPI0029822323|nr:hypothetical protein [Photobacterium leiognathi]